MQDPTAHDVLREFRPAIKRIIEHLSCFNCYSPPSEEPVDELDEYAAVCTGIAKFQGLMGVPATGIFDAATAKHLKQPHCHNHKSHEENIFADDWYKNSSLTYCFEQYPDNYLTVVEVRNAFETAFMEWGGHLTPPLRFEEKSPHKDVDIRIGWRYDFGKLSLVGNENANDDAVTECTDYDPVPLQKVQETVEWKDEWVAVSYSPQSKEKLHADIKIYFNEWADGGPTEDGQQSASRIFPRIVLHQIGHILGLGHSASKDSVMLPVYKNSELHKNDIYEIKKKCGSQFRIGPQIDQEWREILGPTSALSPGDAIVAAPGNHLYKLCTDGVVLEYNPPSSGWDIVSGNYHAMQIDASPQYLYLLTINWKILRRARESKIWEEIDSEPGYWKVIRAARDGKELYKYCKFGLNDGLVSSFSNEPGCQWRLLDANSDGTMRDIVTTASQVFFIHKDGGVFVSEGAYRQCHLIHNHYEKGDYNATDSELVGSGDRLYQLDASGQVLEWDGMRAPNDPKSFANWSRSKRSLVY
ncbi:matrix metallopeptidase 19 [Orbilia oligospora]|uniref:Matrix metallopeptidase 19 n=1 Tax=Orbilia oligospora TaxID=2813651 RepID=A0A7C8QFT7_ORBOL|nr:matrix metallopeptidase 19 [Orbilia oligospora]